MSYYCKGGNCPRKDECSRHLCWLDFVAATKKSDIREGFETGVWFVKEIECINGNFNDGVFPD